MSYIYADEDIDKPLTRRHYVAMLIQLLVLVVIGIFEFIGVI